MYPKKTSTTLNPCCHNHCFCHARYRESREVAWGGMKRHNHPFCMETVVTERVKGGQGGMPQHQLSRESDKNCLSKHRQRWFQGQILREYAFHLLYSFLWNGKAVDSVRSVFKLSPVQTLPRTGFSLYTATIGEIRTNAPTKRPEKEGWAKLWEKNEGVTHSVWWLQNRF